jgi:hypothetical protein
LKEFDHEDHDSIDPLEDDMMDDVGNENVNLKGVKQEPQSSKILEKKR